MSAVGIGCEAIEVCRGRIYRRDAAEGGRSSGEPCLCFDCHGFTVPFSPCNDAFSVKGAGRREEHALGISRDGS